MDEPPSDSVGSIDGESIAVSGPMGAQSVRGQILTMLRSGSDVRVKSGSAHIDLVEGGKVSICGPAHISVLKSGGALTIALDNGVIHTHVEREPAVTIYTAQIQAQPVAIGDGPRDTIIGFDTSGAMCIRANRGAVRLEQQLTGQSVMVPQGGDVLLANGQLDAVRAGHCSCELTIAKTGTPALEVSRLATADELKHKSPEEKPENKLESTSENKPENKSENKPENKIVAPQQSRQGPNTGQEPIYQVFVPPLMFDAKAKVQPEIDPKMIVLIRRARVRPTLIFQGRVEGQAAVAAITPTPAVPPKTPAPANSSVLERMRAFMRKLWPRTS
jgi:hypothetical protein